MTSFDDVMTQKLFFVAKFNFFISQVNLLIGLVYTYWRHGTNPAILLRSMSKVKVTTRYKVADNETLNF